jgi:hypothetical protein
MVCCRCWNESAQPSDEKSCVCAEASTRRVLVLCAETFATLTINASQNRTK